MKVKVLKAFKDRSPVSGPYKMHLPGEILEGAVASYALASGCAEVVAEEKSTGPTLNKAAPEFSNKTMDRKKR